MLAALVFEQQADTKVDRLMLQDDSQSLVFRRLVFRLVAMDVNDIVRLCPGLASDTTNTLTHVLLL
jgi:hypothetical protein